MGKIGSRLIYSRSQIPWHNGIDEQFIKTFKEYNVSAIPNYFDAVYTATRGPARAAHAKMTSVEEIAKNLLTVKMMRISLDWDPQNYDTAYDLAFLLRGPLKKPEISLAVLNETLDNNITEEGKLLLLVQKFLLLHNHLNNKQEALKLIPQIRASYIYCRFLPQNSDRMALLSCAKGILQLEPPPIPHKKTPPPKNQGKNEKMPR
jgi:hypothetical protein